MRRSFKPAALCVASILLTVGAGTAQAVSTALAPGSILVDDLVGSDIQQYDPAGNLLQKFTGTGTYWEGASITPAGNVVTTYRNPSPGVDIFSPGGTQVASFPIAAGFPGDVSVLPDGILAINDQNSADVLEYTQTGTLVRTVPIPGAYDPFGNVVSSNNGTLWVSDNLAEELFNFSETGVLLNTINLSFQPGDLVVAADGSLYVTGYIDRQVFHLDPSGSILGSFTTPYTDVEGIGLTPDGSSLYVSSLDSTQVMEYSTGGTLENQFAVAPGSTPLFLTVAPASAVVPEPASAAVLAIAAVGLLTRRRRDRCCQIAQGLLLFRHIKHSR